MENLNKLKFESAMQVLAPELANFKVPEDFDLTKWAFAVAFDAVAVANKRNISAEDFEESKESFVMHLNVMQDLVSQHLSGTNTSKSDIDLKCYEQSVPNDQEDEPKVVEIDLVEDKPKFKRASPDEGKFFKGIRSKKTARIQVCTYNPDDDDVNWCTCKRCTSGTWVEPSEAKAIREPSEEF
jgi:hypothetical protein